VTALVGKYHDVTAEGGRDHRVVVAVHPSVKTGTDTTQTAETEPKEL
jgi:hypothetical protein